MNFQHQARLFSVLLEGIDLKVFQAAPYCKKYLGHLLGHRNYYLDMYVAVLEKLLMQCHKPVAEICVIDTGAGNGVLSLFASYCGFKSVLLNEIDPHFVEAARQLSHQLQIPINAYFTGDLIDCQDPIRQWQPDAIIGTDMIEHIYDPCLFFNAIRNINPKMASVFTTGSNPANPFKVFRLKQLQKKDEWEGGQPADILLFGHESHPAYFIWRKKLIREYADSLSEADTKMLALGTRGRKWTDIQPVVDTYLQNGKEPVADHSNNTCHPITGSWTERLLPFSFYRDIYSRNGFELKIDPGFYNVHKKGLKSMFRKALNRSARIFGIRIAPFIFLSGGRK